MRRTTLIALGAVVIVAGTVAAFALAAWWGLPSAESEVDAYLARNDIRANAAMCESLRYDSDPTIYRCAMTSAGSVRIGGWQLRQGTTNFCFSVPRARSRFGGDALPVAPDDQGDCISRALSR